MAQDTKISWANNTFNIVVGCERISPGCMNCYAEKWAARNMHGWGKLWGAGSTRHVMSEDYWKRPLAWNRKAERQGVRTLVFCSSLADNFEDHPIVAEQLKRLWPLIQHTPNLIWQLLTKRADRILANLPDDWGAGYQNVWLGTSIENMAYAWRADELRKVPASVRFISYEPALAAMDDLDLTGIHWLIYGGESKAGWRQHDLNWAKVMLKKCRANGTAFFYKQDAGFKDGVISEATRKAFLDVQEYPAV